MKKLILKTILLITTALLLNNCAAVLAGGATGVAVAKDPRGFSGVIDDQQLEHKINKVLDKEFESGSYTIASFNGNVLIAGQVPNQAYKDKINLAVKSIIGVKSTFNYLIISKNETLSEISHDTYLTSVAKTRLFGQADISSNNIKVVTCNKNVYLLGKNVGDKKQLEAAINGINQIAGVNNVINLIENENK